MLGILQERNKPCTCANDPSSGEEASNHTENGAQAEQVPSSTENLLLQTSEEAEQDSDKGKDSAGLTAPEMAQNQPAGAKQAGALQVDAKQEALLPETSPNNASVVMKEAGSQQGGDDPFSQAAAVASGGETNGSTGHEGEPTTFEHASASGYEEGQGKLQR